MRIIDTNKLTRKTYLLLIAIFALADISKGMTDQERRALEQQQKDGVRVDDFRYTNKAGNNQEFETKKPDFYKYNHGICLGLNDYLVGGTHFFYDYNIHNGALLQIHLKYTLASQYRGTAPDKFYMTNSIEAYTFLLRKLFDQGLYLGLGAELGQTEFKYNELDSNFTYDTKSVYRDIVAEIGWQAQESMYVTVGGTVPFTVTKLAEHDFSEIPDDDGQRGKAEDLWSKASRRTSFIIELGWYFDRKTQ
jgi:hypothetical protein